MKTLIAYFSAEFGATAKVAKELAELIGADLYEIAPVKPYSKADLKWMNPLARCNRERMANKDVPVAGTVPNFEEYATVYIGFPIWYGCAPLVVSTFCKAYDWSGKTVYAFATSGGSGIGKTAEKLSPYLRNAVSIEAKLVHSGAEVRDWMN